MQSDYASFDFELSHLPASGKRWAVEVSEALLRAEDVGRIDALDVACSACQWSGSMLRNADGWQMQAHLEIAIQRRCDRCLGVFNWSLQQDCERRFALNTAQRGAMDEDVDVLTWPGQLNVIDLLREEIWLAWKPVVICNEACKGLCKSCGCNLNTAHCQCDRSDADHPFAALKSLKFD